MKSRLEIWKDWCKHCTDGRIHKILVLFGLAHSPSFEFIYIYIRENYKQKYGYSPFARTPIDSTLLKRIFKSYDKESEE